MPSDAVCITASCTVIGPQGPPERLGTQPIERSCCVLAAPIRAKFLFCFSSASHIAYFLRGEKIRDYEAVI